MLSDASNTRYPVLVKKIQGWILEHSVKVGVDVLLNVNPCYKLKREISYLQRQSKILGHILFQNTFINLSNNTSFVASLFLQETIGGSGVNSQAIGCFENTIAEFLTVIMPFTKPNTLAMVSNLYQLAIIK